MTSWYFLFRDPDLMSQHWFIVSNANSSGLFFFSSVGLGVSKILGWKDFSVKKKLCSSMQWPCHPKYFRGMFQSPFEHASSLFWYCLPQAKLLLLKAGCWFRVWMKAWVALTMSQVSGAMSYTDFLSLSDDVSVIIYLCVQIQIWSASLWPYVLSLPHLIFNDAQYRRLPCASHVDSCGSNSQKLTRI